MILDKIKEYFTKKYGTEKMFSFRDLKIRNIDVFKSEKKVLYTFSFPQLLNDSLKNELLEAVNAVSVKGYKVNIEVLTDKTDPEIAKRLIWQYLQENCQTLYNELIKDEKQITTLSNGERISVVFEVEKNIKNLLMGATLDKMVAYFKEYTSTSLDFFINQKETADNKEESFSKLEQNRERTFQAYLSQPKRKVLLEDKRPLYGKLTERQPKYIIDVKQGEEAVTVCGKALNKITRESKGKNLTVCKFNLKDFSGTIPVVFFAKEDAALKAFSSIYDNDEIIVRGRAQFNSYDNRLEILANALGRCKIKEQQSILDEFRPLPPEYVTVFPEPYVQKSQTDLFNQNDDVPEVLKGKTFVVFDFETTGIVQMQDRITEIGAAKIVDGKIVETFSTLINPQIHITSKTVAINGIDDELVKDKPLFQEVCGDFYKFTCGSTLVAHNADFDYGFLSYYGTPCGYLFNNDIIDTITLAKKLFEKPQHKSKAPKNYSLDTLSQYFKLDWDRPHRADCDAVTQAMLFLKLIDIDNSLI